MGRKHDERLRLLQGEGRARGVPARELCREDAADIREHMDDCEDCTTEHRVGVVLIETVRRACKETAPEELRGEILARIRLEQSTH